MSELQTSLGGASSSSWSQRAQAGRDLAAFADDPAAADTLAHLLLDTEDTAVTRETAAALASSKTMAALRLIALAVARADDDHADWLQTGVRDALAKTDLAAALAAVCEQLSRDPELAVREGTSEIRAWIPADT